MLHVRTVSILALRQRMCFVRYFARTIAHQLQWPTAARSTATTSPTPPLSLNRARLGLIYLIDIVVSSTLTRVRGRVVEVDVRCSTPVLV
jgi:hypothetical protein